MTVESQVTVDIRAQKTLQSGLTSAVTDHSYSITVEAGDSTKVFRATSTFPASGSVDTSLSSAGFTAVKLVCVRNLSTTSSIAMSAGWNGSDFRNFIVDALGWNFSPMINLGALTLRGYPIRPRGSFLISCPNSEGFSTQSGGDIIRVGGVSGQSFELYVMGV